MARKRPKAGRADIMTMPAGSTKVCRDCSIEKLVGEFGPRPRMRDGLNSRCRVCANAYLNRWKLRTGYKRGPKPRGPQG